MTDVFPPTTNAHGPRGAKIQFVILSQHPPLLDALAELGDELLLAPQQGQSENVIVSPGLAINN